MNFALIFAGGVGQRMNTISLPKQFLEVHGKPIIVHTVEHFQKCSEIDAIVVVCLSEYIDYMVSLKEHYNLSKIARIVPGGDCGQESIFHGLEAIYGLTVSADDIVLIHDGVRPLIDEKTIRENIDCVKRYGTCITVAKAIETVVLLQQEHVKEVVDRSECYLGRAPQSFFFQDIYQAHQKARAMEKYDFIDSALMMQFFGYKLHTVLGPVNNIKVTTPMDYYMFKAILDVKENEQIKVI